MHRIIEAHARRSKMHPTDDRGRFQFSASGEDDRSGDPVIRKVFSVLHPVTSFITHIFRA
jgi:hypothetical protein